MQPEMFKTIAAFSGGKDSTAMCLLMAERGEHFEMLFTPTGDEEPVVIDHIARIVALTKAKLVVRSCGASLAGLIDLWKALPNWRQRWCTRKLKIESAKAYLLENPGATLCVGLRADEEDREGLWGEFASYRYPLRDAGMGIKDVQDYIASRGIIIPQRTDCQLCFFQRLIEWYELWRDFPDKWAKGEELEEMTGHTFRSASRDTWPASMKGLRERFEKGDIPKDTRRNRDGMCRVCSL